MTFPKTKEGLEAAGYKFANAGKCRGCGAEIEWWTTPRGKNMPLDVKTYDAHFATCPKAEEFRKK